MGKEARLTEAVTEDGRSVQVLVVLHGDRPILVRMRGECIAVLIMMEIPEEITSRVQGLPQAVQKRILATLRYELLSNGRTAFALRPSPLTSMADLRAIRVEQLLRISEEDPSSFNRFSDAIQEVVTTTSRAYSALVPLLPTDDRTADSGDREFPHGMYA